MKAIVQKVRNNRPSLLIASGIALSGLILWYSFYGPCGTVTVKSSIKEMNEIYGAWQELRETAIPDFSKNGAVTYDTITTMQGWKGLAYQLQVPSCLDATRSNLIDAIESDYQTFALAKDRIPIDQKMGYLTSNAALFVHYEQNVDSIEACAPTCSLDKDFANLFEVFRTRK